jgi:NADPH:quinone reductase
VLASTLRARPSEEKAAAVQRFGHEMLPLLARGEVEPVIDRSFPLSEVAAAFDHMENGTKRGKVLLDLAR